jgi:disulfide oxidoreductase YuzD
MELPEGIEKVETHDIQPGDVLVLRCTRPLSKEQADWMQHMIKKVFPDNLCVVMDKDTTIEVYRTQQQG